MLKRRRILISGTMLALLALFLFACGNVQPLRSATPTPTVEPTRLCDCFWGAEVQAWLDDNGNGVFEPEEEPLEGCFFYITTNANRTFSRTATDANGYAVLHLASNDCNCFGWSLGVGFDEPEGYTLVSQGRDDSEQEYGGRYLFGFAKTP